MLSGTGFGAWVLIGACCTARRTGGEASPRLSGDFRTSELLGALRGRGLLDVLDPDGLGVHELLDAEFRQLAPVAAVLDAAEGEARVGLHRAVDEDAAGLV